MKYLIAALAAIIAVAGHAAYAAPPDDRGADRARVYVAYKDGQRGPAQRALAAVGAELHHDFPGLRAYAATIPAVARDALARNPAIAYVEEDPKRYPMAQTVPYGITMVQADEVNAPSGGGGAMVCIIDSGYDGGHPDLPGASGSDDPGGAGAWDVDGSGHGTHVAGTIAAVNNGIGVVGVTSEGSGNVPLHIVKVFGDDGAWAYSSSLVAALDECENAAGNANLVVNMSLGGSFKSRTEDRAFSQAYNRGVLSIAAAGNDGNTRKSYPASYDSVISVAAVDELGTVASFSQQNDQVELAAPGVLVLSTVPEGTGTEQSFTADGTSYAAIAMDGSPFGTASGTLVDCGVGTMACPGGSDQVCLISRGDISFADKVLACQAGGGAAAVIYNNEPGPLLGTLGGVATSIPSVGISQADGLAALAGPGTTATVTVAVSDYAYFDGTSMATPHVAGVAALVWSQAADASNEEIRQALAATAADLGPAGRDNAYGFGLVQAKAALDSLGGGGGDPTDNPPTAEFTFGCVALACSFDASGSSDDGGVLSYAWSFGEGSATGTGQTVDHTYGADGTYTVTLTVTDSAGQTDVQSQDVTVSTGTPGGFTLTISAYKTRGVQYADLSWTGSGAGSFDVYRDSVSVAEGVSGTNYTDSTGQKGGGSATYQVCEAGTSTCSNAVNVSW